MQIVEADFALKYEASDIRDIASAVAEAEALEPRCRIIQTIGAGESAVHAERPAAQVAEFRAHSRNCRACLFYAHSLAYHEGYDCLP